MLEVKKERERESLTKKLRPDLGSCNSVVLALDTAAQWLQANNFIRTWLLRSKKGSFVRLTKMSELGDEAKETLITAFLF